MFGNDIIVFLCRFDDLSDTKLVKLDICVTLTTSNNRAKVMDQLIMYSQQDNVQFVQKSIRAVGRLAVVFDQRTRACVDSLVSLVQSTIDYVDGACPLSEPVQ
jgi:vesicle coat complex subunit